MTLTRMKDSLFEKPRPSGWNLAGRRWYTKRLSFFPWLLSIRAARSVSWPIALEDTAPNAKIRHIKTRHDALCRHGGLQIVLWIVSITGRGSSLIFFLTPANLCRGASHSVRCATVTSDEMTKSNLGRMIHRRKKNWSAWRRWRRKRPRIRRGKWPLVATRVVGVGDEAAAVGQASMPRRMRKHVPRCSDAASVRREAGSTNDV